MKIRIKNFWKYYLSEEYSNREIYLFCFDSKIYFNKDYKSVRVDIMILNIGVIIKL